MVGWISFPNAAAAQARQAALKTLRLQAVWGGEYDGSQTIWPDGITTEAVSVLDEYIFAGPESFGLLDAAEKARAQSNHPNPGNGG